MLCSEALFSSSAIAKVNTNAPPTAVETQEVDLTLHNPENPPSPSHAPVWSSSGVPTIVMQGGSSGSTTYNIADDGQLQGMPYSSSNAQTVAHAEGRDEIYNNKRNRVDSGTLFHVL